MCLLWYRIVSTSYLTRHKSESQHFKVFLWWKFHQNCLQSQGIWIIEFIYLKFLWNRDMEKSLIVHNEKSNIWNNRFQMLMYHFVSYFLSEGSHHHNFISLVIFWVKVATTIIKVNKTEIQRSGKFNDIFVKIISWQGV